MKNFYKFQINVTRVLPRKLKSTNSFNKYLYEDDMSIAFDRVNQEMTDAYGKDGYIIVSSCLLGDNPQEVSNNLGGGIDIFSCLNKSDLERLYADLPHMAPKKKEKRRSHFFQSLQSEMSGR